MKFHPLRPGVKNPRLWFPERADKTAWNKLREKMLTRDDYTCQFCGHRAEKYMQAHHLKDSGDDSLKNLVTCCVACHAVNHFGRNLQLGVVEIWQSPVSQVEIVRITRAGIKAGKTLVQIKKGLKLKKGPFAPASLDYANSIIDVDSIKHTFSLKEPLSVVFVALKRWQLDEE
jgi:hypothetical protein